MKNAFYFISKGPFVLKIFKFFVLTFWACRENGLIRKIINFEIYDVTAWLTLKDLFISESCIEIKIELNFYFHTSLWCLKRFYEGL